MIYVVASQNFDRNAMIRLHLLVRSRIAIRVLMVL